MWIQIEVHARRQHKVTAIQIYERHLAIFPCKTWGLKPLSWSWALWVPWSTMHGVRSGISRRSYGVDRLWALLEESAQTPKVQQEEQYQSASSQSLLSVKLFLSTAGSHHRSHGEGPPSPRTWSRNKVGLTHLSRIMECGRKDESKTCKLSGGVRSSFQKNGQDWTKEK